MSNNVITVIGNDVFYVLLWNLNFLKLKKKEKKMKFGISI